MKKITGPVVLVSLLLLSACGGGGSSSSALPSVSTSPIASPAPSGSIVASAAPTATATSTATLIVTPTTAPSPVATATLAPASAGTAQVTVTVPNRGPANAGTSITPLSTIVVQLNSLNGSSVVPNGTNTTTEYTVPNQQNCVAPTGCSFSISAPSGTLSITATAYAATHAVATATQTVSSTGNAGQNYTFALGGIVQNLNFASLPNLTKGKSTQLSLGFTISDPSGALLLDSPLANPINLTDTDTSSASGLEIAGSGTGPQSSVTITTPATSVLFDYNGATLNLPSVNGQTPLFTYSTPNYSVAPL